MIDAELEDVQSRLLRLYDALEKSSLTYEALSPRILSLRHREDQLAAAREEAVARLTHRKVELPTTQEIKEYVADFRSFLAEGTIPEQKALIRNFVQGVEVMGEEATLTYTIPMPSDGVTKEGTPGSPQASQRRPGAGDARLPSSAELDMATGPLSPGTGSGSGMPCRGGHA